MIEIHEILCPTDFSETSRHALEHAIVIAKWYDARIAALHVIPAPVVAPQPVLVTAGAVESLPAAMERQAVNEQLFEVVQAARQAGLNTDIVVSEGKAAVEILDSAAARAVDLIVIGTHGLGGFERLMLGSTAEKVLRRAACPVMTVPPAAASAPTLPYKRLLCPVDFSESSLSALRFAFSLAKEADANLTILHVFDWPPDDELLVERFDAPAFRRAVDEEQRGRLEALVTDDARTWCRPTTQICYGKPYRQILEIAEREKSDLIVMGVRGRNPLDLTLFGSTTNHVVRRATCPVLTLKH